MLVTSGLLAVVALVGGGAAWTTVAGQSRDHPKRPRLAAGADTNDARAYFDRGAGGLSDVSRSGERARSAPQRRGGASRRPQLLMRSNHSSATHLIF